MAGRRNLYDGIFGGDGLGLEHRRFSHRHRGHFDPGHDLARYDRNSILEGEYRHPGQAVET